jgi:hypothetical protein
LTTNSFAVWNLIRLGHRSQVSLCIWWLRWDYWNWTDCGILRLARRIRESFYLEMRFWLVTSGHRRRSQRGMVRVLIVDLTTHSSFVLFSAHAASVPVFNSMLTEAP